MYSDQKEADAWFLRYFPQGHATSLRPLAKSILAELRPPQTDVEQVPSHAIPVCTFHPRALELLLQFGRDYEPDLSKEKHFDAMKHKPTPRSCFKNSWQLMEMVNEPPAPDATLRYVEGLVYGYCMRGPMLHAWNASSAKPGLAIDWTMYTGCAWSRYLGIEVTEEEFLMLQARLYPNEPRRAVSLLDVHFFPQIEHDLRELLLSRSP